jgi:hypothetical protein
MPDIEHIIAHRLQFSPSHLGDFLDVMDGVRSPINHIQVNEIAVCRPGGWDAFDLTNWSGDFANIQSQDCYGCMACVDQTAIISGFTNNGAPVGSAVAPPMDLAFIDQAFQGSVWSFTPNPAGLALKSRQSEENTNNPVAAMLVWRLSQNPERTYFSCSPQPGELDIHTGGTGDLRNAKLDVVVGEIDSKFFTVLEGKTHAQASITSRGQDQWARYQPALQDACTHREFDFCFAYVIGGDEQAMYPVSSPGAVSNGIRDRFFNFISSGGKKYISLEALRAMYLWKLVKDNAFTWERDVVPLFAQEDFVGIVSGGVVRTQNGSYVLEKAPWA